MNAEKPIDDMANRKATSVEVHQGPKVRGEVVEALCPTLARPRPWELEIKILGAAVGGQEPHALHRVEPQGACLRGLQEDLSLLSTIDARESALHPEDPRPA